MKALIGNKLIETDHSENVAYYDGYRDNVFYSDAIFAQIMDMIAANDMASNSLIVICGDHGEEFGEKGFVEHGMTVFEEGIKVPLIFWYEGINAVKNHDQSGIIDIFPTMTELFALPVGEDIFEGRSLAKTLMTGEAADSPYYFSIASGHKLAFSMRNADTKYVFHLFDEYLFNILEDPTEEINLLGKKPVLATWLRQRGMGRLRPHRDLGDLKQEKVNLEEDEETDLKNLGYLQ